MQTASKIRRQSQRRGKLRQLMNSSAATIGEQTMSATLLRCAFIDKVTPTVTTTTTMEAKLIKSQQQQRYEQAYRTTTNKQNKKSS